MKRREKMLELERTNGAAFDFLKGDFKADGKGDKRDRGEKADKGKEELRADKTADGFFRVTMAKHQSLSALADNKAHLMMTICAGIIGFTFKHLFDPIYVYATAVLIGSCVISAALAVYATMPKLGIYNQPADPSDPHFNLTFFSDFARLPYDVFEREMEAMLRDQGRIYRGMIQDLYSLGKVLHDKKYRYLGYCYRVFVGGLVLSAIVLAVSMAVLGEA